VTRHSAAARAAGGTTRPTIRPGDFLPRLTGWHRWFRVNEAGHYRFIDLGGSVRKWGIDEQLKSHPEVWQPNFGDLDDALSQQIMIRLTSAFFRHFLYGAPAPILDDPHRFFPLVVDRAPISSW
jgi:hypothetical protein